PTTDPLDRIGEVVGALDQLHVARCTPPGSERRGRPRCPNWKHDNAERYRLFDAPKKSAGSRRSCWPWNRETHMRVWRIFLWYFFWCCASVALLVLSQAIYPWVWMIERRNAGP